MDNGACSYRRFLSGDDDAIVDVIREYKDGLLLYLNGFVRNIDIAEELMCETFFKIMVKKPRFFERSSFKTWLYAIARNEALAYLKKSSKLSDAPIEDYTSLSSDDELEKTYLKEERKIAVHRALTKLNSDYRQVLHLIYFEDFDNAQTAIVMKKSKRQIETLLYRAKKSLKEQLIKEGFIYEEL